MMSKQRHVFRICSLFQLVVASAVIVLVGGGAALLWQLQQKNPVGASAERSGARLNSFAPTTTITSSNDISIVGPPSLPAVIVDTIFKSLGSPMLSSGKVVEQASRQANIDDAFALAVWWTETNDGAAGVGRADLNPGSVRGSTGYPSAYDGYTVYPSYTAAINDWFKLLKNRYVDRGLSTVYSISHPYVGTSNSPLWAGKVITLMLRYRGESPPPQPTPIVAHHSTSPAIPAPLLRLEKKLSATDMTLDVGTAPHNREVQVEHSVETRLAAPEGQGATALSQTLELVIVYLALLAALVIALWSIKIGQNQPIPAPQPVLPFASVPPPSPLRLPSRNAGRHPPIRRIVLLPPLPDMAVPGDAAGTRSIGLLSRYGEVQELRERGLFSEPSAHRSH